MAAPPPVRLTQYAAGGGCACKVPAAELEQMLAGLPTAGQDEDLLVGVGDDGAAVRMDPARDGTGRAVIATTDFFAPVADDPGDWGRIAAANALSDVYAMGGTPVLAVSLLGWPRASLALELAGEVLRGAAEVCAEATTPLGGGHSIDSVEPTYGLAVTGLGDPDHLLRQDAAVPGTPLTLTKPLGLGILNNRHKQTGERFEEAVAVMTTLNRDASRAALAAGIPAATDVTGFGLLGHLFEMMRASGTSAVIDAGAVPYVAGACESIAAGYVPGGTRRNLDWVREHLRSDLGEEELLLLADAQTSGGLLVAGELPGHPVVGEVVARGDHVITVR